MLSLRRRRGVLFYCASIVFPSLQPSISSFLFRNRRHPSPFSARIYPLTPTHFQAHSTTFSSLQLCGLSASVSISPRSSHHDGGCRPSILRRHLSSTVDDSIAAESTTAAIAPTTTTTETSSKTADMDQQFLAKSWVSQIMQVEEEDAAATGASKQSQAAAIARTIPLFLPSSSNNSDGRGGNKDAAVAASVPFVCRYRTDIIRPLSTQQVHALQSLVTKHTALQSLREKLLVHFPKPTTKNRDKQDSSTAVAIHNRILASTSKTELDDLYAPFKPPSKGSILERIQAEHPKLVQAVDAMWQHPGQSDRDDWIRIGPREALIQLLATKIAAEPQVTWMVQEELRKYCRIQTTSATTTTTKMDASSKSKTTSASQSHSKYSETYGDFSGHLAHLKDHQVLAIRRGVNEKALKMAYDIDSEKMEKFLIYQLRFQSIVPSALKQQNDLLKEAVHDAWSRLLRRRGTTRLWSEKCKEAQDRACQVFEDNLRRALLAPPYPIPAQPILALDPGFAAGIKCAVLDADGSVQQLTTIKFVGSDGRKQEGIQKMQQLLQNTETLALKKKETISKIIVALGNGHGSQECREVISSASSNTNIPIEIQLVNEAGASVWSVTKEAQTEFPKEEPAAIAAISIGRRLQNPLFELVKVPPKSLGLGMYQHDLSEKELDEKLQLTSVDAVATVGVMVNSCSAAILEKIPGLTPSLAGKIIKARPIERRDSLLKISGMGPKTFENCAGFVRVSNGPEPLDDTMVHPESYDVARWLLKKFSWKLDEGTPSDIPARDEWSHVWRKRLEKAANEFSISTDRVLAVLDNLVDSLSKEDPRLKGATAMGSGESVSAHSGNVASCRRLPGDLSNTHQLEKEVSKGPLRGIVGTVRNVADFGAFIDIGSENDGLLHISKLGPSLQLPQLLIGQQIGVDVLSASNGRVSLGLHGCNLDPASKRTHSNGPRGHTKASNGNRSGSKRSISTVAKGQKRKRKTSHSSDKDYKKKHKIL